MSKVDDAIKVEGDDRDVQEQQTSAETVVANDSSVKATTTVSVQQIEQESLEHHKENDEKEGASSEEDDALGSVRLLGEPLVTQGPYTFYGALGYSKRDDLTNRKRRRWKKQESQVTENDDKNTAATAESCNSSPSCCCGSDNAENDLCSCNNCPEWSSGSSSSSRSEWSVVRMNHFYSVRPWYSIRNSSNKDRQQLRRRRHRKHSPKLPTSTSTTVVERGQHHYQQSVCIGELELLWRDDSIVTTTADQQSSLLKKRCSNRVVSSSFMTTSNGGGDRIDAITSNSNSQSGAVVSSEDDDGVGNDDDSLSLPRRRTLPRRTRQPSAKKLAAAESYAAVTAAAASENHPLQNSQFHRSRLSMTPLSDPASVVTPLSSPSAQYKHGNILCSVRLYVMPDQTAAGRLGGVHGEDEVLEINTWGANGGVDRWPSNIFLNGVGSAGSIYNGGSGGVDDYGYGSGSHSSGTLPSGCSGLVLRAEDFIEWVRGGLMNDDDEIEETESDESLESECGDDEKLIKIETLDKENKQKPNLPTLETEVKSEVKEIRLSDDDEKNNIKLESNFPVDSANEDTIVADLDKLKMEKESKPEMVISPGKVKKEQIVVQTDNCGEETKKEFEDNCSSRSAIDEAVEAEYIPLAAAKIHKKHGGTFVHHQYHCRKRHSLVTKNEKLMVENKVNEKHDNQISSYCKQHHRNSQRSDKKIKYSSSNKQRLVVMSYSRYCRYRAQLQKKREEQFNRNISVGKDDIDNMMAAINRGKDTKNITRVLFCRDTYDYPAELLLEPFNVQSGHQQNTTVLVNHLAPKLKGWPAYPSSWMSFRWNRVRRRLRHLEHGGEDNEERRRRRRRRKLKETCRQRQNGTSGATVAINYSSSTEDDYSDDSDSDDTSSASNDAATNSTTTTSTSDSDGAPPQLSVLPKTVGKNHSSVSSKVNGSGVHHNNKKMFSIPSSSSMIVINGATSSVTTVANNKRIATATGQPGPQQLTKRRRVIYTTESQPQKQNPQPKQQSNHRSKQSDLFNQFNQSPRHQNMLVQQQQQRIHSLNRRLPPPISSLHSSTTTRVIHHHLPPSVTIMPVIVPTSNTASHQQQRLNNRLQTRQKHTSTQRQNNNSDRQQMTLPPVIIEYDDDDNHEYASDDNKRYKKSVSTAMAACHRRVEQQGFEEEQRQQREEEERQRRWLVDALRLGGLEVTAVPPSDNTNSGNDGAKDVSDSRSETSQQQSRRQWRQRGVSFESLLTTDNECYNGNVDRGDVDSNQESDSDSVMMTVTPDVICILNKSQQQEPAQTLNQQEALQRVGSTSIHQQQEQSSVNVNNEISSSESEQNPVTSTAAAVALHDKINRAIDSLKQQQQQSNTNLEITLVPVTAPSTTDSTKLLSPKQQKRSSSATAHNFSGKASAQSSTYSSSSMTVRQQLQRRNATASVSIMDSSRPRGVSITTTTSSSQQKQMPELAAAQTQQKSNDKRKSQHNKKD